jgi:hypothetical protein
MSAANAAGVRNGWLGVSHRDFQGMFADEPSNEPQVNQRIALPHLLDDLWPVAFEVLRKESQKCFWEFVSRSGWPTVSVGLQVV